MLGWFVIAFRQTGGGSVPARFESLESARLAEWQTGLGGLEWLRALAQAGDAHYLGGDGYPVRYTGRASALLPPILAGPPNANPVWGRQAGDVVSDKWKGRTTFYMAEIARCAPEEWLLIEAWDES